MDITITIRGHERDLDVRLDENQIIAEAIDELVNANAIEPFKGSFLRLPVQGRIVSVHNTFKDEGIISGDILQEA